MVIFFWIMMAVIVAMIANARGRSVVSWFLYALVAWPIALVHILLLQSTDARPGTRRCPECAEVIQEQARICRFCGAKDLPPPVHYDKLGRVLYDRDGRPARQYTSWQKLWWKPGDR
jgi:zinc-ribbon domain